MVFLLLIWLLSLPFWLLSYLLTSSPLPDNLPLTDIGTALTPNISAMILRYRESGSHGVKDLFQRIWDFNRIKDKKVIILAIVIFPVLYLITYFIQIWLGLKVADGQSPSFNIFAVFLMFYIAAIAEELGYGAYATEEFQKYYSPFKTAIIIGIPWALWHLNSMIQVGQDWQLILWGLLGTVAVRIIYVWLFNISNYSVAILILCHTVANTARTFYPGSRPAYEYMNGSIGYGIIIFFTILLLIKTKFKLK